uniref:Low-temperature-induced 65 kDa protein n=2 Tax=Cajanus cajan TaxID=3821 RepID=A0A151U656_CAJCA|nr:Low-temperature-induced 65 kDa protein [Cajanus cajan]
MTEDPEVHETLIHESEDVKTITPTSGKVENLGKSGNDFGGTTVKGEEPGHDALLGGVSSTTEIDQNTDSESAEIFSVEEKAVPNDNLERSIGLEEEHRAPESTPETYKPPSYHTKVPDPSGVEKDEIEITPVEESFGRMNVKDEPEPTPEPNVQPSVVVDPEFPPAGSHDQFVPHLSAATQTHDHFTKDNISSTNINTNPAETGQTFNTITTPVEEQPLNEASTDEVVFPKEVIASEVGSGENDNIKEKVITNEEHQKSGDASPNMSDSTAQNGKNIAHSLTEKLAPVYEKVAGVGSAVKSKVTGGVGSETKDGVSVKDYLAEKLRPGEEDKALSEVISEALHKRKEEAVANEDEKMCEEKDCCVNTNSQGKGVVDKLKGVVGSWFGKSEEKGGGDLSKNTNSGAEVEQVNQVVGEIKSSQIEDR